jgi:hypothetical protein
MNALFASAALGLLAAWPASGLGWALGKAADRLTGDPAPRAKAWNQATILPPAVLAVMVGVSALPAGDHRAGLPGRPDLEGHGHRRGRAVSEALGAGHVRPRQRRDRRHLLILGALAAWPSLASAR